MMTGLGAKVGLVLKQIPSKTCERCGLSFSYEQYEKCPHRSGLNETELDALISRLSEESEGNALIGRKMAICAILVLIATIYFAVA